MQNFLVLGIVPGTQYQITFTAWLALVATLLSGYLFLRMRRRTRNWLLCAYAALRIEFAEPNQTLLA